MKIFKDTDWVIVGMRAIQVVILILMVWLYYIFVTNVFL